MSIQNIPAYGYTAAQYQHQPVKIYYADNDSVPAEKRGKELSQDEYKQFVNTRLGAVKAPKAETIKNIKTTITEWAEKYMEKPKKINPDHAKDNIQHTLDIVQSFGVDPFQTTHHNRHKDKGQNLNTGV